MQFHAVLMCWDIWIMWYDMERDRARAVFVQEVCTGDRRTPERELIAHGQRTRAEYGRTANTALPFCTPPSGNSLPRIQRAGRRNRHSRMQMRIGPSMWLMGISDKASRRFERRAALNIIQNFRTESRFLRQLR